MYESYRQIIDAFSRLSEVEKPDELIAQNGESDKKNQFRLDKLFNTGDIISELKGNDKQKVIVELIDCLDKNEKLLDKALVAEDVLAREESMSTGLGNSLAIPHARTKGVDRIRIAVGMKNSGVDFQAPDKAKSRLIILILAPKEMSSDYLAVLSSIAGYVTNREDVERFLNANKPEDVYAIFSA
jgi:mannitol/fructose-specific phosphotransferase system IIA component (Ntr-type)